MKPIKWILLVAFAGLIFPQLAAAETISQIVAMDWQRDWTEKTACVDQFDPSLGILKKVTIEMETCDFVNYTLHSEDSSEQCFIVNVLGRSLTTLPNGDVIQIDLPDTKEFCVEPWGSYGFIIEDCQPSDTIDYTDPYNLAAFIGSGEACFVTDAEFSLNRIGTSIAFSELYMAQMMHKITVTYEYENEDFCISGHKFNDLTDEDLADWTINLKDASGAVIETTTTDANGEYSFCILPPGSYTVCEVMKPGWTNVGPACIPVELVDENVEDIDFRGKKNIPCGSGCPWFIKNELYTASCIGIKEVGASKGILANDPDGTTVINPETISIDPKYGTITVEEDGSFVFDPSPEIKSGTYVVLKYGANNGFCDARYLGIAKIQVSCKRSWMN